jgi:hypothetical protein
VNKFDQLQLQVGGLVKRIAALEAALAADPAKRRTAWKVCTPKRGYTDVPQSECDQRWNLRVEYEHLKFLETCNRIYSRRRGDHLPTSLAYFAEFIRDEVGCKFNLRELQRFFARKNTFAPNSRQCVRITAAYRREIDRLHAAGYYIGMPLLEAERLHTAGPVM